nr:MAG TPA: hypothetical protein [Caudoviricetes sp.]DAT22810.1 MAG TPA: hypothetical protein [Caudoviricetes sp.]
MGGHGFRPDLTRAMKPGLIFLVVSIRVFY